jgi:alkylation response protein AidB-like acyl-CoA dehydrogenase
MPEFIADLRDLRFALFEHNQFERLFDLPRYRELDADMVNAVLDEAFKFTKNQIAPMNPVADALGATYDKASKQVKMPECFHETHKLFTENGWLALEHSPEWGGQGMPYTLALACNDMFFGGCLAFCLNGLLTNGAAHLIETYGSDELKSLYLEKLYSGQWTGTMCLTEAGAGSDVGASRTRATREGDHFLIEGEKVFITAGEHDLTENICHAVLARIDGAPAGTKGLSLFLVPKMRVNPDGSLGEPNDVECAGIEHKMGIHGSPTCTMLFGSNGKCQGWLLGEENRGMAAMFQMMNEARISVGLQGAALANTAYQLALAYSKERVQGKDVRTGKDTVIHNHPDVRQMLMWQKAISEGTRALVLRTAMFYDLSRAAETEAERDQYLGYLELFTPVCKAYASDIGFRSIEMSLQTLGGYGYLTEYGIEQLLRDAKIASIYEGTNGIQALDLIGRKMPAKGGDHFKSAVALMGKVVAENLNHPALAAEVELLGGAQESLVATAGYLAKTGYEQPAHVLVNATPFLDLFGQVAVGWLLIEQAVIAFPKLVEICKAKGVDPEDSQALAKLCDEEDEARFYAGKVGVARFYARRSLTQCIAKAKVMQSGDLSPLETPL